MPRKAAIGVCVLSALALCATIAPAAQAANTWEGTWITDFGEMKLDAGGSGSYEGFSPGTISGKITGSVNEGTWEQPGPPVRKGTFTFTMSGDGKSFEGDWAYESGGCGTACGWDGTCSEGACTKNGIGPGGGGGGIGHYDVGKYVGETSQGEKVKFKVKRGSVKNPSWAIDGGPCKKNHHIDGTAPVDSSDSFRLDGGQQAGPIWSFSGKFVGRTKVKGSIVNSTADIIECQSVTYTATLQN